MLTFKQYILESTGGNYVSLEVDDPEIELKLDSGTIVPSGKHHITLIYSEGTNVPEEKIKNAIEWMTGSRTVKSKSVVVFDSQDNPSSGCIVLKIDSDHLQNIHEELKRIGLRHSYSDYQPHVTLAYDVDIEEARTTADHLNKKLQETPCLITMRGLTINKINDNWSDDL